MFSENEVFDEMLDAANSASRRTRFVLMGIQLFTLLVAVSMFNAWKVNWTDERIRTARAGLLLIECPARTPSALGDMTLPQGLEFYKLSFTQSLSDDQLDAVASHWAQECFGSGEGNNPPGLKGPAMNILRKGYDKKALKDYIESLEEFRMSYVLSMPVPFVGAKIDINGLGIFAGLGLSILFLWLGLSLSRERQNLRLIEKKYGRTALDLVKLEALFTPHDDIRRPRWLNKAIDVAPIMIISFPLLMIAIQFYNDAALTLSLGKEISWNLASATILIELIFLLINGILFNWCRMEYGQFLLSWRTQFGEKDSGQQGHETAGNQGTTGESSPMSRGTEGS